MIDFLKDAATFLHKEGWPWWLVALALFWGLLVWGVGKLVGIAGTGLEKLRDHYQSTIAELTARNERLRTERDDAERRLEDTQRALIAERVRRTELEGKLRDRGADPTK
jgi:uncharacterized protein YhaN